jgi:histidyl-tRNA synthetase
MQTLYVKGSNAKKQMQRAFDAEIPMILWVGENELASGKVKLKVTIPINERFCTRIPNWRSQLKVWKGS